jgi:hypothetical protein
LIVENLEAALASGFFIFSVDAGDPNLVRNYNYHEKKVEAKRP